MRKLNRLMSASRMAKEGLTDGGHSKKRRRLRAREGVVRRESRAKRRGQEARGMSHSAR